MVPSNASAMLKVGPDNVADVQHRVEPGGGPVLFEPGQGPVGTYSATCTKRPNGDGAVERERSGVGERQG